MAIVDQFGTPIQVAAIREAQTSRLGAVARQFDEHPARGMTPAKLHSLLVAAEQGDWIRQLDLADDMEERDGHIYAELDKRRSVVASLEWSIVPPKDASAAERRAAEQAADWISSIDDIEDLVRGMMDAALKSFAAHEMTWEPVEGVLLPRIQFRPQRWFTVDRERRNELLLRTDGSADGEALRPFCWIAHVHKTRNGYLARGGLVRVLAWPYLFKNFAVRDLAEFLEIYGLPLRLGRYPTGATDDEKRRLLQAVTQIGHNAAGIIPQSMAIDFQSAAQGQPDAFVAMVDQMEATQSKVILGQTLTSGEGKHGTQALGKVHDGVRQDIRDSDARQVAATLTRQLVWPIVALNIAGADPRRMPRFVFDTTRAEDLLAFSQAIPRLVDAGMQISQRWVADKLRMPLPAAEEAVLQPLSKPASASDPQPADTTALASRPAAGPSSASPPHDHSVMDEIAEQLLRDGERLMVDLVSPLLAEVEKRLATGASLAQLRAQLPELVGVMDARPVADRLARATFAAGLVGAAGLDIHAPRSPEPSLIGREPS